MSERFAGFNAPELDTIWFALRRISSEAGKTSPMGSRSVLLCGEVEDEWKRRGAAARDARERVEA